MSRYGVPFVKGPEVRLEAHPKSCQLEEVGELARSSRKPVAIDLFSGAGGLSYGLHLAGFEVVLAVDKEPEAAETHRAHFPGASLNADLSDKEVLESIASALKGIQIDLVAGGPPCQPYSQAAFSKVRHLQEHHGKTADPRRELWSSFLYIVKETLPRAVLIENVPDMAFGRDGIVLRRLVANLEELGYTVHSRVLCSDAYGVPQHRQRLFTVAFKNNLEFAWPDKDESIQRKLKHAISDLPAVEGGDKQEMRVYDAVPGPLQKYFRESVPVGNRKVIFDHHTRAVRKDDLEAFKLMTSKTTYRDLPAHLKRYRDDIFEDKYKRLDMESLSRTITAHISQDGYWYIHPTQHRTLTIREAARIQTFPDSFRFCGYPRHAFKQIGEAVPPLFGRAVGASVLEALAEEKPAEFFSSNETENTLTSWIANLNPSEMRRPWLSSSDIWVRIMGQLLFDRASLSLMATAYETTMLRWSSPQNLIADRKASGFADEHFKFEAYESLRLIARALTKGEELSPELLASCYVPASVALRVLAVTGTGSRRPLNTALERLVRRFTGIQPKKEDGRGNAEMLLGRMVGCDPDGKAFCALNEVVSRFCGPRTTCSDCPLKASCHASRTTEARQPSISDELSEEVLVSAR